MTRSKPLTLAIALAGGLVATFAFGLTPARALDLDDLPPIRRIITLPVPSGPVIVIPVEIDD